MVVRFFYIVSFILFLSGCSGKKNKMKDPVDFTPRIEVSSNGDSVISKLNHLLGNSIDLPSFTKAGSHKLLKDNIMSTSIKVGEYVYAIDKSSNLYKILLGKNPKVIWSYNLFQQEDSKSFGGAIIYDNAKLYITNGSRYLFIIDALTGEYILEKQFPNIISTKPLINGEIVYIQDLNNNIYALDTNSGSIIWKNRDNFGEILINEYDREMWLYDNNIISLSSNGALASINKINGQKVWLKELYGTISDTSNSDNVMIKDFSNKGFLNENFIYTTNTDGYLYKIDIRNGSVIYKVKMSNVQTIRQIENLVIFTNSANQAFGMLSDNGEIAWSIDLFDKKMVNIASFQDDIVDGWLYIITDKESMIIIDKKTGKIKSKIKIAKDAKFNIFDNQSLYIFSGKSINIYSMENKKAL